MPSTTRITERRRDGRGWSAVSRGGLAVRLSGVSTLAVVVYLAIVARPVLLGEPGPLQGLRTAFWNDQLGYLSIVANAAAGDTRPVEPMTLSGVNHYPSTYYVGVGLLARLLALEPVTAWNLVAVLLQVAAVVALALATSVLSRRWWLGALAPAPFLIGTLSFVTGGGWSTALDSHAVLWGPYGVLFSNNAETSALCLVIVVLSALALVWLRPSSPRARVIVGLLAAVVLGLLSGFQTYSFLTGVYVVAAILAAIFLTRSRWWWTAATVLGVLVVLAVGPFIAERGGQLATLVFGLLPALPGLLRGVALTRGLLLLYGGLTTIAAAPPIVWTLSGILGGDPFLAYRVGSNVDLGVIQPATLVASSPLVLVYLLLIWLALRRHDHVVLASLLGVAAVAPYLAVNDFWGANAEPYRFWINCVLLGAVVAALALARLLADPQPLFGTNGIERFAQRSLAALTALVVVCSFADAVAFTRDPGMETTWNPDAPRERALEQAADEAAAGGQGLLLTGPCISAPTIKVLTPVRIAHYYLGMAWPAEVEAVSTLQTERDAGALSGAAVSAAGADRLLLDSACADELDLSAIDARPVDEFGYGDQRIELWSIAAR